MKNRTLDTDIETLCLNQSKELETSRANFRPHSSIFPGKMTLINNCFMSGKMKLLPTRV